MGVFQLSGEGMTKWLKELKPNRVEDIMAMVALYRPGPMAIIPEYIARKNDPSKIEYFDPKMEKFLKASYGLLVYQDDCLYTAIELAGYNWTEVDKFRKAIGKKIPEEMAVQKEKFIAKAVSLMATRWKKPGNFFSYRTIHILWFQQGSRRLLWHAGLPNCLHES
jgi:DNA polymerase III subunit alpha